ncbi:hypothetical protein [Flavivirga jejuensis]|uniref:Uncharacterized protein n=1 Tax=Flavivirga jejuensis TaxID=870487 RepID=A0ABT8WSQ3_9FLAO|nr:hypothetical protein [Flavivirga jejuensis]MDO5976231.1 hypothetical protein [Flavivirga jejuensis]
MKTQLYIKHTHLIIFAFFAINTWGQESTTSSFLRDNLMVYYVQDPESDQYTLLNPDEIIDGGELFGGNAEMQVAQSLVRSIYNTNSDGDFQESIVRALRDNDDPSALFIYFDSEPVDEVIAAANWTDYIESGHFTPCLTREENDDYASAVHYGANQLNIDCLETSQNRLVELLNGSGFTSPESNTDISGEQAERRMVHYRIDVKEDPIIPEPLFLYDSSNPNSEGYAKKAAKDHKVKRAYAPTKKSLQKLLESKPKIIHSFGHGWNDRVAIGTRTWRKGYYSNELIEVLREANLDPGTKIIFHHCSSGATNGVLQKVSEALPSLDIYGNIVSGDGVRNSQIRSMSSGEKLPKFIMYKLKSDFSIPDKDAKNKNASCNFFRDIQG